MMVLAGAIILMHAMVPHHHHDCDCDFGLVFENEVACHCDEEMALMPLAENCETDNDGCCHHDEHSHHPLDFCLLQDLLSHLVLSNKDDETYLALSNIHEHNIFYAIIPTTSIELECFEETLQNNYGDEGDSSLPPEAFLASNDFRGPPFGV